MGDWLEGNKMRTQSMLQARQMTAEHDQRKFDNLMKGMTFARDTAMPYVQKELEVAKAEDLYGPGGVMNQYETGQKELDAKLKSEANIKSFKAAYPNIPAFDVDDKGNPTKPSRAYMMYTFGFDPNLQWSRYAMDRDKQYGGVVDALREGFSFYGKEMNDMMTYNPETGAAEGFDPNDKSKLIDNLTMTLQRHEQASRWGTDDPRKARQLATEWVNTAEWKEMQKATVGFETPKKVDTGGFQKDKNIISSFGTPGAAAPFGPGSDMWTGRGIKNYYQVLKQMGEDALSTNNRDVIAMAADHLDNINKLYATISRSGKSTNEKIADVKKQIGTSADQIITSLRSFGYDERAEALQSGMDLVTAYVKGSAGSASNYGIKDSNIPRGATPAQIEKAARQALLKVGLRTNKNRDRQTTDQLFEYNINFFLDRKDRLNEYQDAFKKAIQNVMSYDVYEDDY
jgi:hypothetical protein